MLDYYKVLGVDKNASQTEIKQAFRKLAMRYHPDKGGDESKFKEINEAYDTLGDPSKRANYDNPSPQFHGGSFKDHFGADYQDIFSQMFGGGASPFGFRARQPQNQHVQASVIIELEDVLYGKTIDAEIGFRNGSKKLVSINIPKGIQNGAQIRYPGMGDHSEPRLPPGDLFVKVKVNKHHQFERSDSNLITQHTISAYDAMLGTDIHVSTLDRKTLTVVIRPGTQPGTILSCKGEGLPDPNNGQKGNLLVKINVSIPKKLTTKQIEILNKIRHDEI